MTTLLLLHDNRSTYGSTLDGYRQAPQREWLGILQGKIRGELSAMGEVYLEESCALDPNLLTHRVMLEWTMVNPDALETGCLGNLSMSRDSGVEERQRINKKLDLIQSDRASPSVTDAKKYKDEDQPP